MNHEYSDDALIELYDFFLNAPIGLHILDRDYKIWMANQADLDIMGYGGDPSSYLGQRITEFHADSDAADEMLQHLADGRPLFNFRARLLRRDGSEQPVVIYANSRLHDGTLLNTRCFAFPDLDTAPPRDAARPPQCAADLSNGMTNADRRELLEVLDDFFENAPVALHVVGPDGRIRRANRIELESLGYQDEPEKYIGHHIGEFHADQSVIDEMLEHLVGGRPLIHYRARLIHRSGKAMPVVIYSSPRFDGSQFVNTRCFTFPSTVDRKVQARTYSWPRNDIEGIPVDSDPMTVALRRLAGRKTAEESLGLLAETSKALASSDYVTGVSAVCQLLVPFFADWCSIELRDEEAVHLLGTARGTSIAGSDDLVRALVTNKRQNVGGYHLLGLPFAGDETQGALLLVRDVGRDDFGPADVALAEEVARRIAIAVELGRVREKIARAAAG